jgi:exonuclease VII small subunit
MGSAQRIKKLGEIMEQLEAAKVSLVKMLAEKSRDSYVGGTELQKHCDAIIACEQLHQTLEVLQEFEATT